MTWRLLQTYLGLLLSLPLLVLLAVLGGCTAAQVKAERYQEAFENFANPTNLKICYVRQDGVIRGVEYRCFGAGCKLPDCPDTND